MATRAPQQAVTESDMFFDLERFEHWATRTLAILVLVAALLAALIVLHAL
jgi:hypothetical protein